MSRVSPVRAGQTVCRGEASAGTVIKSSDDASLQEKVWRFFILFLTPLCQSDNLCLAEKIMRRGTLAQHFWMQTPLFCGSRVRCGVIAPSSPSLPPSLPRAERRCLESDGSTTPLEVGFWVHDRLRSSKCCPKLDFLVGKLEESGQPTSRWQPPAERKLFMRSFKSCADSVYATSSRTRVVFIP